MKWYGSLNNRIEENKMFCDEIKVGTGMTEYSYSDREAYEVIEVKDQKHITVRKYNHKHIGEGHMDNKWELVSNPDNPTMNLTKRGNFWYNTKVATIEDIKDPNIEHQLWLVLNGFDPKIIKEKGKQTKYTKVNVSFGIADYYYDYEF